MLAALLISAIGALLISTVAVFVAPREHAGPARRSAVAAGSIVVSAGLAAALVLVGVPAHGAGVVGLIWLVTSLGWSRFTRSWNLRGHFAWVAASVAAFAYVSYMVQWTFMADLGAFGTAGGLVLCALEAAAWLFGLVFVREMLDVLCRRRWSRRHVPSAVEEVASEPFVSLHVPAYNEPPDLVIATLRSLLQIEYSAYEIIMIDDNTADVALWHPVRDFCADHGIAFHHLEDWPGYKSGALNYALSVTDPRAEVIGVVDSDYQVEPDYLRCCAPLFADATLGFVQTPQDYRSWDHSAYYRRLKYSYDYFFAVSQVSRNERDGAIFGGTMGLIRRSALDEVGGWDEWCITEDAELSLRLLRAGYHGQHIERSFGHGVMPLTFEALKSQRFRWCFGGVQILRKHWRSLMPWNRSADNSLSWRQRYDYLTGGLQWFGDLLGVAFAVFLALGAASLGLGGGAIFRRLAGALLVVPPLFVALGLTRSIALIRRRTGASARDAAGAMFLWLALGPTVAWACLQGLLHRDGVFLRTPKTKDEGNWRSAIVMNRVEVTAGLVLLSLVPLVASSGRLVALPIGMLLVWHAVGLLSAPVQSFAAQHAELPDALRQRRRQEWVRDRLAESAGPIRVGAGIGVVGAAALLAIFLMLPGSPDSGPAPDLWRDARGWESDAEWRSGNVAEGGREGDSIAEDEADASGDSTDVSSPATDEPMPVSDADGPSADAVPEAPAPLSPLVEDEVPAPAPAPPAQQDPAPAPAPPVQQDPAPAPAPAPAPDPVEPPSIPEGPAPAPAPERPDQPARGGGVEQVPAL